MSINNFCWYIISNVLPETCLLMNFAYHFSQRNLQLFPYFEVFELSTFIILVIKLICCNKIDLKLVNEYVKVLYLKPYLYVNHLIDFNILCTCVFCYIWLLFVFDIFKFIYTHNIINLKLFLSFSWPILLFNFYINGTKNIIFSTILHTLTVHFIKYFIEKYSMLKNIQYSCTLSFRISHSDLFAS